jgi:hypothetical protein
MLSPLPFVWSCTITFQSTTSHQIKAPNSQTKQKWWFLTNYQYKASVLWLMQAMQPLSGKFLATEASRA